MWTSKSEWHALNDALRLSRWLTYKSVITGLNLGGGKAVIIGDAKTQKWCLNASIWGICTFFPDFLINAGGIINVYAELEGCGKDEIIRKTENSYHTTLAILNLSEKENITTHRATFNIAQNRIDTRKKEVNS